MMRKSWIGIGIALALASLATVVLAEYLGPDRSRTTYVWRRL